MQSDRSLMLQHFLNAESQFSSVLPMFSCTTLKLAHCSKDAQQPADRHVRPAGARRISSFKQATLHCGHCANAPDGCSGGLVNLLRPACCTHSAEWALRLGLRVRTWKSFRQAVMCPGLHRSTMKC